MRDSLCLGAASVGVVGDLLIILATAAVVALALQRVRLAVIPAYLLAGAIVGPSALGLVSAPESLESISRLAIILLMFGIGLDLDRSTLARGLGWMAALGATACAATIIIGWPIAMAFGLSAPAALAVCMALSTSSTAVVLRALAERRELRRPHGRLCFAVSAVQDLLVLVMLAALPALARWNGSGGELALPAMTVDGSDGPGWVHYLVDACLRVGGMGLIFIGGMVVVPRLMKEAARGRSTEVMIVLSTSFAIGAAVATQALGFSAEMGAFFAGFVLSATPFRHQLIGQVSPLRDLFIAVFFTTIGMNLDPATLAKWWWIVIVAVAATLSVKALVMMGMSWAFGVSGAVAAIAALALCGASEISLVLLQSAAGVGLLNEVALGNLIAVVVLTLIVTPSLITLGHRVAPRVQALRLPPWISVARGHEPPPQPSPTNEPAALRLRHVVIAGFGVVGRAVAERMDTLAVPYTIIDVNPRTVETQSALGRRIIYGDISNVEVLETAGVRSADAVILTIPDEDAVLRACEAVRSMSPDTFIAARTNFLSKGMMASRLGADHVTVEELATAESMSHEVITQLTERVLRRHERDGQAAAPGPAPAPAPAPPPA